MPKIKISHIVSFSTEDPVHCANNLLTNDTTKKWKCLNPGEKSATVVLQLEKASVISAIDVGNEHSAYVEVLAGRSSSDDDYKVLLVMSSFMSCLESKQSTNVNKVRMFTKDDLQKPEHTEKWDRIKVVCTQPFNRHVQYGLSFITLYSPEEKEETSSGVTTLGKFLLRPKSPDNISAGSLFAKRKELADDNNLTGAAAIRQASNLALNGSPVCKPKLKDTPSTPKTKTSEASVSKERNRNEILYDREDEEPNDKIDKLIEKKNKEAEENQKQKESKVKHKEKNEDGNKTKRNKKTDANTSKQEDKKNSEEHKRKMKDKNTPSKKSRTDTQRRPFHHLLGGVVLVISGIQHPERGDIRAKALEMGAKYHPDWNDACTHLICAFPNTPKFNQVRGKGKIVKKEWIFDCYRQRKRFPWRRYALDKKDAKKQESEDEIWEQVEPENHSESETDTKEKIFDSGSDTEDEIERIQALQHAKPTPSTFEGIKDKKTNKTQAKDLFSQDTDEEELPKQFRGDIKHDLPNFYENHVFYIDPNIEDDDFKELEKYIVAYKGFLVSDPSDVVDTVISNRSDITNFQEAFPEAKVINSNWVWECHNQQKFVPVDDFEIK